MSLISIKHFHYYTRDTHLIINAPEKHSHSYTKLVFKLLVSTVQTDMTSGVVLYFCLEASTTICLTLSCSATVAFDKPLSSPPAVDCATTAVRKDT